MLQLDLSIPGGIQVMFPTWSTTKFEAYVLSKVGSTLKLVMLDFE